MPFSNLYSTGFSSVTPTDRSGTITLGGTAQVLMPINTSRGGWSIYNSGSVDLYVNELGTATIGGSSYRILPGQEYMPGNTSGTAISVIGTTTGQPFVAREWNGLPQAVGMINGGLTAVGQLSASSSLSVIPANNYTESVSKNWKVLSGTGLPAATIGDKLTQTIKNNGGVVSQTWFNMSQGYVFTTNPTINNLFDMDEPIDRCGREEFSLYTPVSTSFTANSIQGAIFNVRQGSSAVLTSQSGFTVPAGKRLRLVMLEFQCYQGNAITFNNDGSTGFYVAYDYGATPTTTSARAISASGRWMWIPPSTNANNSATIGVTTLDSDGVDLPTGVQIRIGHQSQNWSGTALHLAVKGYLYNA
jgi:hypothetical protein